MMFQKPSTIGRYKVLGELGRGTMGVVYLAEDPALKREVAIKLVHGASATQEDVLARFRREAEISARLNHPNVIMVFDVGEEKGFGPFMAMEFADGEPLSDVLARGPMEPEAAALILIQGFHALQAAHVLGIIHRDFKPENLILTRLGRLKLMDFGIARNENPLFTGSGVLCTPSFAAPELLDQKPPSPSSDNWAFCVTAFQMVTGELPFHTGSISSLLYAIVHEPPSYPSDMTPAVRSVFERALEKDPAARYPDLRSFMLALLEALPLEPDMHARCLTLIDTAEPVGEGTTRRWAKALQSKVGRPWIGWGIGALVLMMLAMAWIVKYQGSRTFTLTSYPPQVQVFLDDKPIGTTPLLDISIPAKAKLVRLEKEGYQTLERSLKAEDRMLTLTLVAKPTVLEIQSEPAGAEVFVNNVLMGLTPIQGLQVAGDRSHRLQLRKAGYEPWVQNLAPGEKPPGRIQLRKVESSRQSFWKRLFSGK
jgi:predicted Ser/Thr protein kinase